MKQHEHPETRKTGDRRAWRLAAGCRWIAGVAGVVLAGCAPVVEQAAPPAEPTINYTRSFEIHRPGRTAASYTDWVCVAEVPAKGYREVFQPSRNEGIDNHGVRVDFRMRLPRHQDTEYVFTTTYRVDGEEIRNVDHTLLSGHSAK